MNFVGFTSCIPALPKWSIGLANDRVWGQGYSGQCTEAFGGAKKVNII